MEFQIFYNRGFEMEVSKHSAILNALSREGHFSQHPQLLATKTKFLTTYIRHLDPQFHDKMVVNVGTSWSWEERRGKNCKRTRFVAKYHLLLVVVVVVSSCSKFHC